MIECPFCCGSEADLSEIHKCGARRLERTAGAAYRNPHYQNIMEWCGVRSRLIIRLFSDALEAVPLARDTSITHDLYEYKPAKQMAIIQTRRTNRLNGRNRTEHTRKFILIYPSNSGGTGRMQLKNGEVLGLLARGEFEIISSLMDAGLDLPGI